MSKLAIRNTCTRCLRQKLISQPSRFSARQYTSQGYAPLPHRALISLTGRDASKYLQGLTTASITPNVSLRESSIYSAFLTAQGRVVADVLLHSRTDGFMIEVDRSEATSLLKWLKRYKLRADIALRLVDQSEAPIWAAWGQVLDPAMSEVYKDDRTPSFGFRILQDTKKGINDYGVTGVEESPDGYKLWRMLNGVPEGQKEIIRDTALLQESCIDYMGGVDFRKGCYVGQELVIRTQHTGVVRKRILPVRTYPINRAAPSSLEEGLGEGLGEARGPEELQGKDIKPLSQKGRSVGKYLDGIGNIGLALCRLEEMGLSGESAALKRDLDYGIKDEDGAAMVKVRAFIPEWWQHRTKASNAM